MSTKTNIGWTDSTVNGWIGCAKVSKACHFCYAENDTPARVHRHNGRETWGPKALRIPVKSFEANMLAMNRKPWVCKDCGTAVGCDHVALNTKAGPVTDDCNCDDPIYHQVRKRRIFCDSNSDWLDPNVPIELLAHYLDVLRRCDQCELLLLTKRPELFELRIKAAMNISQGASIMWLHRWCMYSTSYPPNPPPNIWIGSSVEDQKTADERIPHLLRIPAAKRFLSCEPLLGPIQFDDEWLSCKVGTHSGIHWVIVGGESGPNRRPMEIAWLESIVEQCDAAGVKCFVKQDSAINPGQQGRISDALWARKEFPND